MNLALKIKGILLVGMPGCGKSTLGKKLSTEMGWKFVDKDVYVVDKNGKSIKDMFKRGENFFRDNETDACEEVSKLSKVVVSAGGGIVKREENMEYFKDFLIIFINRPLENIINDIDTETRPLLKDGKERLINIYNERIDLYKKYSDVEIMNDGTLEQTLGKLFKLCSDKVILH